MPSPPSSLESWQRHPFVEDLAADQMAILASVALPVQFSAGQLIFREGELANRFYLILDGTVALQSRRLDGGSSPIATLGPGDVLGWSWLFPPYTWHFDAVAVEPTGAVFFYGTWLRNMAEEHHELGYELMKRMAEVLIRRLQATRRYVQTTQPPLQPKPTRKYQSPKPSRAARPSSGAATLDSRPD